jgi:hypothetical protein
VEPVSVGIVVAALIAKALDRAEDGIVDEAVRAANNAVGALRRLFAGDLEVERALESVVEVPDSGKKERALAAVLAERAERSDQLRAELQAVAGQLGAAGVRIGDIEQVSEGDGNVQNAGILNSQIDIRQNAPGSGG